MLYFVLLLGLLSSVLGAPKLGVWWDASPARVTHFENYVDFQVDVVRAANGWADWSDFCTSANWMAKLVRDQININSTPKREIVWSLALITNSGSSLSVAGTGAYNNYYKWLAMNITDVVTGTDPIWVIPGYEFNGDWFPWMAGPDREADFIKTFRHFVNTFRAHSNRFRFVFGTAQHTSVTAGALSSPSDCYPGNEYVDAVGINVYNKPEFQTTNVQSQWNTLSTSIVGLNSMKTFANSKGKPFWIPELGFQGSNYDSNGNYLTTELDITYLVQQFGTFIKNNDVQLVLQWDGFRTAPKPNTNPREYESFEDGILGSGRWPILDASFRAMYRDLKFNSGTPPTPKPTPKPTPAPTSKPTSAPTPKPTTSPSVVYNADFWGVEADSGSLSGFAKNNFVQLLASRTTIGNGVLSFTLSNAGCPSGCGGFNYGTGAWRKEQSFGYGIVTFSAQGTKQAGSALILTVSDWNQGAAVRFLLPGSNSNSVIIDTFVGGYQFSLGTFALSFDHSAGYNTYAIERSAVSIRFLVNGVQIYSLTDITKIPTIPLKIELSYDAHNSWWGTFSYSASSTARLNVVSFASSILSTPAPTPKPTPKPTTPPSPYPNIYDNALQGCWSNITYGPAINYRSTSFVHSSSYSVAMPVGGWYGMYLQCSSDVPLAQYNAITFWINPGTSANQQLRVKYAPSLWTFGSSEILLSSPIVNSWTQYTVTFDQLNVGSVFRGFMLQSATGTAYTGTVYVDDIQLIKL